MSDLTEKLEKLIADREAMKLAEERPPLHVIDIHEQFKHLLTPEAAKALEPCHKATLKEHYSFKPDPERPGEGLMYIDYTRAVYLSVVARSFEGIAKAAALIYSEVNKLAADGKLHGNLCRLSMLRVSDIPGGLYEYKLGPGKPATAVFCFPHVPAEYKPEGGYFIEEGGLAKDLEPDLKPEVLEKTSFVAKLQSEAATKRIREMEGCCPENPCFYDDCSKCSGGPRG